MTAGVLEYIWCDLQRAAEAEIMNVRYEILYVRRQFPGNSDFSMYSSMINDPILLQQRADPVSGRGLLQI
jgi:hypothetical protein